MEVIKTLMIYRKAGWILSFLFIASSLTGQKEGLPDKIRQLEKDLERAKPEQRVILLNTIATEYLDVKPEKSLVYADSANELAIRISNKKEEVHALKNLGLASSRLFKYDDAVQSFQKALDIAKSDGNDTLISNLLYYLGDTYYLMNDFSQAYIHMLNSCHLEEKLKSQDQLAMRYSYMGAILQALAEYPLSTLYFNKAIDIFDKSGDKQRLADEYNNLGNLYSDLGNYNKSLELYQKSLTLVEGLNDRQGMATTLNNIGIVYYDWGDKERALEFFQKSLKIEEELSNRYGFGDSYNNIGIIYSDWDQNDVAIDYYQKALGIFEEYKNHQGMAMALNNIGESYLELGDKKSAFDYLFKSLDIEKELSNQLGIAESSQSIGSAYLKTGYTGKAEEYNTISFTIADSLRLTSILMQNYYLYYQIYFQKKEYAKALEYYKNYISQKDSIYNNKFHTNIAGIQANYEVDRMDKEWELSREKSDIEAKEMKTQRNYLIIIFVLLVIFGFMVYFDIKSKSRANKKLQIINQNLSEQKAELTRTLEELNRNEAKYRNLLEFSPTGIIYLDKKGKVLEVNKKMLELLGSSDEEETKIINCLDYPPLQEIGLSDAIIRSIETHETIFNEAHYKSKWGKKIDFRYYITPILNRKSNVSHLILNVEDVSLSKEFERSKKLSELKYKILVENSLQAMLVVGYTGLVFANSRLEELSQYKFNELADADNWLKLIIHPDDYERVTSNIQDALEKKKISARNEYKYTRKDGTVRWMESLGSVVDYEGQPAILVVAIDITERKEAENILVESEKQLRAANAMKDKFFSIIAHDLKNPFNAILGFSNLLYEAYDNFDDQQRKTFIKNICEASGSTFKLLQNLLEWSRTQTGKIEIKPEKIDIEALINDNIGVLRSAAESKKIDFSLQIPNPTMAYADSNMVKAILRNLVSNAIKFTKSGGKINISAVNSEEEVTITVSDTGIGIKPEDLHRLFRIDDHFRTNGTDNEEGSGLGLILCKEFVEKNEGRIWAESSPGVGSKFIFTLPSVAKI